jgi:hypothetical protein
MKAKTQKEKALILLIRAERYFYKYLLTHDKVYIDRFFSTTKRLKRLISKPNDVLSNN